MASSKVIKNRIKSIKNTKKITKAMELVAASKMKRAIFHTLLSRPYAVYSWDILASVSRGLEEISHPLFQDRDSGNTLLVLITSNRGLCGAYNAQVIKRVFPLFKNKSADDQFDILTIGKKGDLAMRRLGQNVVASFIDLPDHLSLRDTLPISELIIESYKGGSYKRVLVAYTDFVSPLLQNPKLRQLLPVSRTDLRELIDSLSKEEMKVEQGDAPKINYLIEGEKEKLIGALAEKLTQMQMYQMLLESNVSEQSSRMIAMKNASEASAEMIEDLTLVFNKARQANITREISEISAGMASVA